MFKGLYILAVSELHDDSENDDVERSGNFEIWAAKDAVMASWKCALYQLSRLDNYDRYRFVVAEVVSAPYYIPATKIGYIVPGGPSEYRHLLNRVTDSAEKTPEELREAIAGALAIARGQYFQMFDHISDYDNIYFADNGMDIKKDFDF